MTGGQGTPPIPLNAASDLIAAVAVEHSHLRL